MKIAHARMITARGYFLLPAVAHKEKSMFRTIDSSYLNRNYNRKNI
jgi:hypothetical protein